MGTADSSSKRTKFGGSANYRIIARGRLVVGWSDRLAGMSICGSSEESDVPTTTLVGRIRDEAELAGVLDALHDLHLTILKMERLDEEN